MSIDRWIKIHETSFGKVLAKVKVNTQYHFEDLDGKNRYCDFVIQEGSITMVGGIYI
jgi:hypothetical protein